VGDRNNEKAMKRITEVGGGGEKPAGHNEEVAGFNGAEPRDPHHKREK